MVIQKARVSLQEFEQLIMQPENTDRRFELINGELHEKMPTELHAYIIQMLAGFLFLYLREYPIGYALIEPRYRLPTSQDIDLILIYKETNLCPL